MVRQVTPSESSASAVEKLAREIADKFSFAEDHEHTLARFILQREEKLRNALRFYADKGNWEDRIVRPRGGDSYFSAGPTILDKGEQAQSALDEAGRG